VHSEIEQEMLITANKKPIRKGDGF